MASHSAGAAHAHAGSNDPQMWSQYHAARPGTLQFALHELKTHVVCRMFAQRILELSGPVSSALELGCGTASTLERIRRRIGGPCTGVDNCEPAVVDARAQYPRLDLQVGDIFNLPYPEKSFDLVYSVGLFEHFAHQDQLRLLEIHARHARKAVVMMVPADSVVFNSIIFFNKRIRGRSGTWADEQVFTLRSLRRYFPGYSFFGGKDHRFANMIMWFGWRP
ncbi:MAG: class I SAM-dependent methyltransferase [Myxococcota bacterium]